MNVDTMASNIHAVWQACTMAEVAEGRDWYPMAHGIAVSLDQDFRRAAYVIAALSPRQAWARNVTLAREAYRLAAEGLPTAREAIMRDLPTLGLQRRQVAALLADAADPDTVVKGTKTNAFARTIADPTDATLVVVDRHAMAVAYGSVVASADLSLTDKRYRTIADAYREVAAAVGELPSVVQAATWVRWRRTSAHAQGQAAARMDDAA